MHPIDTPAAARVITPRKRSNDAKELESKRPSTSVMAESKRQAEPKTRSKSGHKCKQKGIEAKKAKIDIDSENEIIAMDSLDKSDVPILRHKLVKTEMMSAEVQHTYEKGLSYMTYVQKYECFNLAVRN